MANTLSFNRISLLVRSYMLCNYKAWLTTTLALFSITFFYSSVIMRNKSIDDFYQNWFCGILYIVGILIASKSFDTMHDKTKNIDFLLTPASSLEKTIAPILIISLIFPLYLIIVMTTGSFIIESVNSFALNKSDNIFTPLHLGIFDILLKCLNLQAIFFLGAASFTHNRIIKTILSVSIALIALTLLTYIAYVVIFPDNFSSKTYSFNFSNKLVEYKVALIAPILCWSITWMKVKEAELNHGI